MLPEMVGPGFPVRRQTPAQVDPHRERRRRNAVPFLCACAGRKGADGKLSNELVRAEENP